MTTTAVEQQRAWREAAWSSLLTSHPSAVAPASTVRSLGLYSGYRGVWVDKANTASPSAPSGITVGVRHDGTSYADILSSTGLIYKFTKT